MAGFTPGPWIYDIHEHSFYIFAKADMGMVADGDPDAPGIARMRGMGRGADAEEQEANARLIATAPDLLEACEEMLRRGGSSRSEWCPTETYRKMEAAIAKAKGRS